MKHRLKRAASITFTIPLPDGGERDVTVPPVTVGRYQAALAAQVETGALSDPDARIAMEAEQLQILAGRDDGLDTTWVDNLTPLQIGECIHCLLAVYQGINPEDWHAVLEASMAFSGRGADVALGDLTESMMRLAAHHGLTPDQVDAMDLRDAESLTQAVADKEAQDIRTQAALRGVRL